MGAQLVTYRETGGSNQKSSMLELVTWGVIRRWCWNLDCEVLVLLKTVLAIMMSVSPTIKMAERSHSAYAE